MFEAFFLKPYKKIHSYCKSHGVEFVVHHSYSYCANLLPTMIEMGIDVWQGCMTSNDIPALIAKYGGRMTFMGDIANKAVDFEGCTQADCEKAALHSIKHCASTKYYIPCITQGGPGSLYAGTYAGLWDAIDAYNCKTFGFTKEQLEELRPHMTVMF